MGCLSWLLVGLVAGGLAKLVFPGRDPGGCIVTVLIGIAGAALGGYIGTFAGLGSVQGFDLRSLLLAVVGSLVVLAIYRLVFGEPKAKKKSAGERNKG
ncbi:MAG: GlsB/YeaQ/YmgE family stress response membrane protein [Acidobacteria bacterium]|nr:MAG: GlsB/YeaQ/YmgE family stress response membrane protein [Acidobacteriota bacterium]REK05923.1 MAG: GlsB/YeaQ/YmgE family stress response membrane protein [Acidobacteriota bacterium]